MTATERHPEYVGGPLCGDLVARPEEHGVTVSRPKIGRTHRGKGTHVYRRGVGYDQLYAGEEHE